MSLVQLAFLGALIGLPLGYAMQRTRLCFNSAYREALLHRDATLLRAIVLAILIQMVGLYAFTQFGFGGVRVNVVPFIPIGNILGGLVFGVAMVYAEGCSSTVWYRVGNGNVGVLVTLMGFAVGEALLEVTLFAPSRDSSQMAQASTAVSPPATLPNALGVNPWIIIVPIVVLVAIWLWRGRNSRYLGVGAGEGPDSFSASSAHSPGSSPGRPVGTTVLAWSAQQGRGCVCLLRARRCSTGVRS